MTKKDYVLIATAIAQAMAETVEKKYTAAETVGIVVDHIAHALQADNPRFDTKRFKEFIGKQFALQGEDEDFDLRSEMQEGIVINEVRGSNDYVAYHAGKSIWSGSLKNVLAKVNEWMNRNGYFPNIFMVNDHGNVDQIVFVKRGSKIDYRIHKSWV